MVNHLSYCFQINQHKFTFTLRRVYVYDAEKMAHAHENINTTDLTEHEAEVGVLMSTRYAHLRTYCVRVRVRVLVCAYVCAYVCVCACSCAFACV